MSEQTAMGELYSMFTLRIGLRVNSGQWAGERSWSSSELFAWHIAKHAP